MYVMLLLGTIVSALLFGAFLHDFSPGRLVRVIQAAAVATLVLNALALWKMEARHPGGRHAPPPQQADFRSAWATYIEGDGTRRRLLAIGLGTMAFGMQDVLIEPYGGQVLGMGVGATTWLRATLAGGGLAGFWLASVVLGRGADPARLATTGAALGMPAFAAVLAAATLQSVGLFACGVLVIGFAAGLFGHGTLTVTMNRAPKEQAGLALGAWGAVQATAAGLAVAAGGLLRDMVGALAVRGAFGDALNGPATGYAFVYALEIVLLAVTVLVMSRLIGSTQRLSVPAAGASAPAHSNP
jgi:BCD family chlorophyll transporter-like MFS transporter